MGKDGNMYFVDPTSSIEHDKNARFDRATDVFNTAQCVHTHNVVLHHEHSANQPQIKRPQTAHSHSMNQNRSTQYLRPQSSSRLLLFLEGPSKTGGEEASKSGRPSSNYRSTNPPT